MTSACVFEMPTHWKLYLKESTRRILRVISNHRFPGVHISRLSNATSQPLALPCKLVSVNHSCGPTAYGA